MVNPVYFEDSEGRLYYLKDGIYQPLQINGGFSGGGSSRGPRGFQGPAGPSGSNAPNFQATATGDITTSSATDVVATGMTLTPPAGTYLVWFSGSASVDSNGDGVFMSIYSNGIQVPSSKQRINVPAGSVAPAGTPFNSVAKVTK